MLTTKATIKDVKINIVKGDCIVKRMCNLRVLLLKCPKTFAYDCSKISRKNLNSLC